MPNIDFSKGYTASYTLRPVDQSTWASGPSYAPVISASAELDATDEYPLLQTGSCEVTLDVADSFEEGFYRIEMEVEQNGTRELHPIATLLMSSGSSSVDHVAQTASVSGYSVLKPASDRLMLTGTYAPKGCDGAAYAAGLLRECIPAPVSVEGSFTLDEHAVFGTGISYLQAAWTVLKAADWCMRILGDGTVHIAPKPSEATFMLDVEGRHHLMPGVDMTYDLSEVPNRYFAVDGDDVGIAVNEQDGSRTSVSARGRYVDYIDDSPVKVGGETMTNYAKRKLEEMSTVTREWSYTREYVPDLVPFDLVAGSVPEFGMSGAFRVIKQSIDCGKGVTVSETLGQETKEYIA